MIHFIYTIVEQAQLQEMLNTFSACTGLPIQIVNKDGIIIEANHVKCSYCSLFKEYIADEQICANAHHNASTQALKSGESYIYACHSDLNHIIFPLYNEDSLFGSIVAGPFLLNEADSDMIKNIGNRFDIAANDLIQLYDQLKQVKVIDYQTSVNYSKLLYFLFSNLIDHNQMKFVKKEQDLPDTHQKSKLLTQYKDFSIADATTTYPIEKERDLITKVKTGNITDAKSVLDDLIVYVKSPNPEHFDVMKSRALEICTLLSRASIEGGNGQDKILKLNSDFIKDITACESNECLHILLDKVVETFADHIFYLGNSKNKELIKTAISYIASHYAENVTLEDIANEVHLNPAYFSTLFKKELGISFKEYLNMIRIEESKRLLSNSSYSVVNVALAVGFEDQSYFSKVFKKYVGVTPSLYR